MAYKRKKDGVFYHPAYGRLMRHEHRSLAIHWSTAMLDQLRREFPTTLNNVLAECLGVSESTMHRKARELGLKKDPQWLAEIWDVRRRMAYSALKLNGYPGGFAKGHHACPEHEYKKGRQEPPEEKQRRIESFKRWCRTHPDEVSAKARKAWETKRAKARQAVTASNI